MPAHQTKGPFCQSCGMPLTKPEDFGTLSSGFRVNDYCHYCFSDGQFTSPEISMAGMIDQCVAALTRQGMTQEQARTLMTDVLPRLKRWQAPAATLA
jgi:hypothetical protein